MVKIAGLPEGLNGQDSGHSPLERTKSILGIKDDRATIALKATDDGRLKVEVSEAEVRILAVDKITAITILSGVQTVVTYTILSTDRQIQSITGSGTIYAKFEVFRNAVRMDTLRSGPIRNVQFEPFKVDTGDIIELKVSHQRPTASGDFEGTIRGI